MVIQKRERSGVAGFDRAHGEANTWKPDSFIIDHAPMRRLPRSRYERHGSSMTLFVVLLVVISGALAISSLSTYAPLQTKAQATYDHDVAATSINSPPGTAVPGNITVSATVENIGNLPSGQFQVNLSVKQSGMFVPTFNDSFETASIPPPGWSDLTFGSQLWVSSLSSPHSGLRCMRAGPEFWGKALLGSPAISVGSGSELTFWSKYVPSGGLSELYITLSFVDHSWESLVDSPNATLGVLDTSSTGGIGQEWTEFSYDLSAYAGETVYIGFTHNQPSMGSDLYLDDVSVGDPNGSVVIFSDEAQVSNLVAGGSSVVEFNTWNATEGNYTIEVVTYMVGDENRTNDLVSEAVTIGAVEIPEFPVVVAPVLASIALVFGASGCRRRRQ